LVAAIFLPFFSFADFFDAMEISFDLKLPPWAVPSYMHITYQCPLQSELSRKARRSNTFQPIQRFRSASAKALGALNFLTHAE
jgi:hypothetical protein